MPEAKCLMPVNYNWGYSAHMKQIARGKATSLSMGGKTLEVLEVVASGFQLELQTCPL